MKFTIRDLLLVTVIVALAVGWWVDHRDKAILRENGKIYRDALQNEIDWNHHDTGMHHSVQLKNGEFLESNIDRPFIKGS